MYILRLIFVVTFLLFFRFSGKLNRSVASTWFGWNDTLKLQLARRVSYAVSLSLQHDTRCIYSAATFTDVTCRVVSLLTRRHVNFKNIKLWQTCAGNSLARWKRKRKKVTKNNTHTIHTAIFEERDEDNDLTRYKQRIHHNFETFTCTGVLT